MHSGWKDVALEIMNTKKSLEKNSYRYEIINTYFLLVDLKTQEKLDSYSYIKIAQIYTKHSIFSTYNPNHLQV